MRIYLSSRVSYLVDEPDVDRELYELLLEYDDLEPDRLLESESDDELELSFLAAGAFLFLDLSHGSCHSSAFALPLDPLSIGDLALGLAGWFLFGTGR